MTTVFGCSNCQRADCKLLFCSRCRVARYCGVECQREHWRRKHREVCGRMNENVQRMYNRAISAVNIIQEKHPVEICLMLQNLQDEFVLVVYKNKEITCQVKKKSEFPEVSAHMDVENIFVLFDEEDSNGICLQSTPCTTYDVSDDTKQYLVSSTLRVEISDPI